MKKAILGVFLVLVLADVFTVLYSIFNAPYPGIVPIGDPTAYRNIYIHVPVAVTSYILFGLATILAALYIARNREKYEHMAHSFIIVGLVYSAAALVTGSIWANESWGSAWNWDPRETGVLMMFIAYLVYVLIRRSIRDPLKSKRISMAYAIIAFSTVPISFALPYVVPSLHPVTSDTGSFLVGTAAMIFGIRMLLVIMTSIMLTILYMKGWLDKRILVIPVIVAIAVLFVTAYDYRGDTGIVVNATLTGEGMLLEVYTGGETLCLAYNGTSPVKPETITLEDGTVWPTIVKHTIKYELGPQQGECYTATSLEVINHWSVYADTFFYFILIYAVIIFIINRG